MLKVTELKGAEGTELMLEGKLLGPWVDELQSCWSGCAARQGDAPIRVILKDVSYVDVRGRDLLKRMERQGARLVEASDFIRHVLSNGGSDGQISVSGIHKQARD